MAIMRWLPGRELDRFRREIDRMFDEFFSEERFPALFGTQEGFVFPALDVYDEDDKIIVKAELPGVSKDDIEIVVRDNELTIKGEKKKEEEVKEENYYYSERSFGKFVRTIRLPVEIKADEVKARFKNGILEIELPKVEEARPKEIKVQVEE
ncbi:HSP20 family protein [Thermosulfidibacter takaii ABI70S6]|uniref:HSP20 family protein n=1 Tax=Thermosulfidibacter takaii (strain DSM 17441 / JCM 13301 / NBRC 103674 / ABI70S6) TaxID=1298851 RepID=A0A0S3QV91_THET7|nr:Hsp20/alpha crystallin family protein [Thermosulfidibacter takaii]BAT72247.1 HSP20 family protein [Thermosulfidibacter takaii ABI70S6]